MLCNIAASAEGAVKWAPLPLLLLSADRTMIFTACSKNKGFAEALSPMSESIHWQGRHEIVH